MRSLLKALVPLTLLGLLMLSTTFGLFLKIFVDFLSLEYAQSGTVVLLVALALVFLTEPLASPWKREWNKYFLIGVGILLIFGLIEKLLLMRALGLSWDAWAAVCFDGKYVMTRATDMREPLAAISYLPFLGPEYKAGVYFREYLPTALLLLHCLVFVVVCGAGFLVVHQFTEGESTERSICLALCVFTLLKVTVDGGIFSPEVAVPIPFILGLLYGERGTKMGWGICLLYLPLTLWLMGHQQIAYNAFKALGGVLLLEAPLLWDRARTSEVRHWYLVVMLYFSILLSIPWFQYQSATYVRNPPFTLGTLLYGLTPLEPGRQLTIFSDRVLNNPKGSPVQFTGSRLGQAQQAFAAKVLTETTPMELCEIFGLSLFENPIAWSGQPIFVELRGVLTRPQSRWPTSPMVMAYYVEPSPTSSRVVFQMRPGCRFAQVIDALPPGKAVITEYQFFRSPPAGVSLRPGPGRRRGAGPGPQKGAPGQKGAGQARPNPQQRPGQGGPGPQGAGQARPNPQQRPGQGGPGPQGAGQARPGPQRPGQGGPGRPGPAQPSPQPAR